MKESQANANSVQSLVRCFRILNNWNVSLVADQNYSAEVSIHPTKPEAVIYACHQTPPIDFELHEVLHCALRALKRTDDKADEESLVQDICALLYDNTRFACEQTPNR